MLKNLIINNSKIINNNFSKFNYSSKIAVVLSGCGVYDGAEIHESSSTLIHLDRLGIEHQCFAPNKPQHHIINHLNGDVQEGERNVLEESARIARGNCKDLNELNHEDFDAIIFPGGFGAAKNLSDFAFKATQCKIDSNVSKILVDFQENSKPIGLCCISPVIAAKIFPGCSVTIGDNDSVAKGIETFGSKNVVKPVSDIHYDEFFNIVSTPAYMIETANSYDVFNGIGKLVEKVNQLVEKK
eukprot:TRINITY_DN1260_c1_g1_i1.p1 TRINITY_DN1260_c1_g1~~TRINITY_DN1260_c1_g1_i1.p1  ORF type:complete len:242 (+),score=95.35 TRINITY_DN1260_c1_g1_i1:58-783(+)